MPLTQDQKKKVENWLISKNVVHNCPSCGQRNWTIGEIISAPTATNGNIHLGGCYYCSVWD